MKTEENLVRIVCVHDYDVLYYIDNNLPIRDDN